MSGKINWDPIRDLAQRVLERGESLELTEDTRTLLIRTAQETGIGQQSAEESLRNEGTARTLLEEAIQRINEGSDRLSDALLQMYDLRDQGNLQGACQLMRHLLTVEVVPLYRRQAEGMLEELTGLAEVSTTGRVNANLPDRPQLAILERRVQQGLALELTEELRALLYRTAPTAAFSEAETEEALKSTQGAEALMGGILSRFRDGKRRITLALYRMTSLRDAGDLEGARQQMRDVLAVEVVPQYRQMAEENLAGLDKPFPSP
jgi:DUSAM domain-containing protein